MKKIILIIVSLLILVGTNYYTYTYTRESYRAVGFNDGSIDARFKIANKFLEILKNMPYCNYEKLTEKNLILTVKTHDIYYIETTDNSISFCQSK